MFELRQSTAVTIEAGPFLDEDDGKTTEEALTITQGDVRLAKNSAVFAQKSDANPAVHDEKGFYGTPLNITDTNEVGRLKMNIHESGALPVFENFMVITAADYDAKYGVDARGAGHLVQLKTTNTLAERAGLQSGTIDRSGYPHYGVIFTDYDESGESNLNFDPDLLEGAIIENTEELAGVQDRYFQILGGYFFNDTGDTISKVFGIALETRFGLVEGGPRISTTSWAGTDIDEATHGNGWTFIVAGKSQVDDETATFPDDGDTLRIWLNPAYQRTPKIQKRFPDGTVYFDGGSGLAGTTWPRGTASRPVNLLSDARTILSNEKLWKLNLALGGADRTAGAGQLNDLTIFGMGSNKNYSEKLVISQLNENMQLNDLRIHHSGEDIRGGQFNRCVFLTRLEIEQGYFLACDFEGAYNIRCRQQNATSPAPDIFELCHFDDGMGLNLDTAGATGKRVAIVNCTGGTLNIQNVADALIDIYIDGFNGDINIEASCTAGNIYIRGLNGRLTGTQTIVTVYGTKFDSVNSNRVKSDIEMVRSVTVDNVAAFQASVSGLAIQATSLAIKAKTDLLPADPASQALIAGNVWNAVKTSFIASNSMGEVVMELVSGIYGKWRVFRDAADSNKHKAQLFTYAGAAHKTGLLRDKTAAVITELFEDDKPYQRDDPA